ncbi:hypothetical protein [Hyphomicrobium sulfonivorans]|nr:hypothetical protein [Hyphomicrobium sulfonivorans]
MSMIQDDHLDAAIAQGIISPAQAAQLRALAASPAAAMPLAHELRDTPDPDDERFRLIGGFNDVFVTIGIVLLVSALFGLTGSIGFAIGFIFVALASAWVLSEIFISRLRLALPAIALAVMFALSGALAVRALVAMAFLVTESDTGTAGWAIFSVGLAIAAALHRWRFKVPIDTALIAAGLIGAITGSISALAPEQWKTWGPIVCAACGLAVFAFAVRIDATDPERTTRRSDVAFWLHMLAAPMIVYAASSVFVDPDAGFGAGGAVGVLALFAVFGLVALVIDRRALLVSALSYAGLAIGYLLKESVAKDMSVSLTLLGLAVLVLTLSARWRSLRRAVLDNLPLDGIRKYVPPAS